MKQEIRFKGMSLDRDELATQHGELAFCGGVDLHNGSLRPSILDGTKIGGENAEMKVTIDGVEYVAELVYVHSGLSASYPHYIGKIEKGNLILFYWFDKTMTLRPRSAVLDRICAFNKSTEIYDIKSVGNVLTIMTSEGIHYLVFKDEGNGDYDEYYDWLGLIPELDIQFGLTLAPGGAAQHWHTIENVDLTGGSYDYDSTVPITLSDADQQRVTPMILAEVNQAIHEIHDEGYFTFPFYVRYAFRLYDGSLIRHSAPILMMPSGSVCRFTPVSSNGGDFEFEDSRSKYLLTYYIPDSSQFSKITKWSDIIKSVDVYISAPIYTYDQSGLCKRLLPNSYYYEDGNGFTKAFYRTNDIMPFDEHNAEPVRASYKMFLELPQFDDDIATRIGSVANFFLLKSIPVKDLVGQEDVEFEPQQGLLNSITARKQMTDDYDSHDFIIPKGSFLYNARLNTYNISKEKYRGFHPVTCFNITNNSGNKLYQIDCYVHIKSEEGTIVVDNNSTILFFSGGGMPRWFYYPDPSAFKAVWLVRCIYGVNWQSTDAHEIQIYELDLKAHPMLNGAYWFDDFNTPNLIGTFTDEEPLRGQDFGAMDPICDLETLAQSAVLPDDDKPLANTNTTVSMPNSIYTSKTNNPFFFPNLVDESGVNIVGSGIILGMATVTRALSTGQVGDQDLIVFASDGIWVMKVSFTGTYTNINNISREVCTGQENICQLDQSVIFATNRSINRFVESDSISISDVLDGPNVPFSTIMQDFCNHFPQDSDISKMLAFAQDMNIGMLANCKIIYDYSMLRLIVLQKNNQGAFTNIALVFCMSDQSWSIMTTPVAIKSFIPGYPYPFYQDTTGKVYILDKPYHKIVDGNALKTFNGAIITRTLAFSESMDIIQGFQQLCNLATKPLLYIYGSNDQNAWNLVGYSNRDFTNYLPGHPFRYFRVAMAITMTTEERYQELILDVINKYAKL